MPGNQSAAWSRLMGLGFHRGDRPASVSPMVESGSYFSQDMPDSYGGCSMAPSASPRPSLAPYPEIPVQDLLRRSAERLPDKTAVIDGDRTFTYRQLEEMSGRFAAALASSGTAIGNKIGVFAPNCVEFAIAFFGILKAGAVVSTVNSAYTERELAFQMNDCGAKVLLVHEAILEVAEKAKGHGLDIRQMIVIKPGSQETGSFWGLIEAAHGAPPEFSIDPKMDVAALPYSSGTTGLAKGVELTHFNLTSNILQMEECQVENKLTSEVDVVLIHLPLFHIYGLQVLMNLSLSVGATLVMMGRFDMGELLGLLVRHKITQLCTVPPVGQGLGQPGGGDFTGPPQNGYDVPLRQGGEVMHGYIHGNDKLSSQLADCVAGHRLAHSAVAQQA